MSAHTQLEIVHYHFCIDVNTYSLLWIQFHGILIDTINRSVTF
jgi:hypothetical protein